MSSSARAFYSPRYLGLIGFLCLVPLFAGCDKNREKPTSYHPLDASALQSDPTETTTEAKNPQFKAHDAHTHIGMLAYPLVIDLMNTSGIHRIVNMSGGHDPKTRKQNLDASRAFPGRIALFFNIDWERIDEPDFGESMAAALEQAVDEGYAGLKISKALGLGVKTEEGQLVAVDDPRLDPIWQKAGELGVVVAIHTSDPKAFWEPITPENERYQELSMAPSWGYHGKDVPSRAELLAQRDRLVARHPQTTFMLLHLANNPEDVAYVDKLLDTYPNTIVDIAARIGEFGRHDAKRMHEFFVKHQDRVLFATDIATFVRPIRRGKPGEKAQFAYRITLGSVSTEPPKLGDVAPFYAEHFAYFESDAQAIDHPVPIQGDWKVHPVDLPDEVIQKIYLTNAERFIFDPWIARQERASPSLKSREREAPHSPP